MKHLRAALPTLMTLGNLFCGFLSVWYSVRPDGSGYIAAAWLIMAAAVFDALDGMIARLVKAQSQFGVELDSLADVCSFGMAPAILLHQYYLVQLPGHLGLAIAFLFFACGALRLARFNTQLKGFDKAEFKGLPIPAAAGTMASMVIFDSKAFGGDASVITLLAPVTVLTALLMVSRVRYDTMSNLAWSSEGSKIRPVIAFGVVAAMAGWSNEAFFIVASVYVGIGLAKALLRVIYHPDAEVDEAVSTEDGGTH